MSNFSVIPGENKLMSIWLKSDLSLGVFEQMVEICKSFQQLTNISQTIK